MIHKRRRPALMLLREGRTGLVATASVVAALVGFTAAESSAMGLGLAALLAVAIIAVRRVLILPPLLLLAATPLLRPNLFGERLSLAGAGLVFLAALLSLINDGAQLKLASGSTKSLRVLTLWLLLAYSWLLFRSSFMDTSVSVGPIVQSLILVVGVTLAAAIVLSDPQRRDLVARGFVYLILALCCSYVVTAGLWAIRGVGSGQIASLMIGTLPSPQPVYEPFTITASYAALGGRAIPRFTGLGREPGWMAMYCAFAFFLAGRIGRRRLWVGLLLLVGVAGTLSTAGFGVLLVTWAFETFLRKRREPSVLAVCRRAVGLAVMAAAVRVALVAPVFGLNAKLDINVVSVDQRQEATAAGWHALFTSPLGGHAADVVGGINLIAAVAAYGIPLSFSILAALWLPRRNVTDASMTTSLILVLTLTLLTSQPAVDSTWVYVLGVLAYSGWSGRGNSLERLNAQEISAVEPHLVPS